MHLGFRPLSVDPIEVMHPVGLEEVEQEEDTAAEPGQRIGPRNGGELGNEPNCDGDVSDTQQTPGKQHGDHGYSRLAGTAQDAGDAVGEGQQTEEQGNGPRVCNTEAQRLWAAGE